MKTEHLLLMESEEPKPTQWWVCLDSNTLDPQGQNGTQHDTRSDTHSSLGILD